MTIYWRITLLRETPELRKEDNKELKIIRASLTKKISKKIRFLLKKEPDKKIHTIRTAEQASKLIKTNKELVHFHNVTINPKETTRNKILS